MFKAIIIVSKHNSMAAPKGNKNALGNRGGGRKSAYQERADAESLLRMFFSEHDYHKLAKLVKSGKFSLQQRFLLKALDGDTRVLTVVFNKLFPDKLMQSHEPPIGDNEECAKCAALDAAIAKVYDGVENQS